MKQVDMQSACKISIAIGKSLFECHGYDAKYNAQRNLEGRTHYVDDDSLKFFHARINSCRTACGGLILIITESTAKCPNNRSRGHRFVAFDLFGNVINDRDHCDSMRSKSDAAYKDSLEWLESFDVLAHYKTTMAERAEWLRRESADMMKAARAIRKSTKR